MTLTPSTSDGFGWAPGCGSMLPFTNWFHFIQLSHLRSHTGNPRILTLTDVEQHLTQRRAQWCSACTYGSAHYIHEIGYFWSVVSSSPTYSPRSLLRPFHGPLIAFICWDMSADYHIYLFSFIYNYGGLIHHHNIPALKPNSPRVFWCLSMCHKW